MTPEERDLLTQSIKISEENNRILKSMRRSARFASFLRIVYWVIILGSAFSAYYIIKPFIDPLIKGYNSVQENIQSVKDATNKLPALPTWLGGKQ
jgi:hypothetical protein